MALIIKDRVRETSSTTGSGSITLEGAVFGFRTFADIGNANTTYYCIAGQTVAEWEVGIGTYTASGTTLSRDTVLSNSLGTTALISFSSGVKDVFCTFPAANASSGGGTVTSVTATSPVTSTGGTTPVIAMPAATTSVNGYLTSADWNTFNGKQTALGFTPYNATNPSGYTSNTGTVTSVAATAGTGISITGSPITTSGTFNITNTAPDQVVSLTAGSNVTITGTYPSFTIASSGGGGGGTATVGFEQNFLLMGA